MKPIPGTLQEGGAPFGSTQWDLVRRAAAPGNAPGAAAERALGDLCRDYWAPIYTFVRRRGHAPSDAQDLTQAFFVHLLHSRAYARADPAKGRFRTFLLAALKNFLADARARTEALKRGGGREFLPLDEELAEAEPGAFVVADPAREDLGFEAQWAAALVGRALRGLRAEFAAEGREALFIVLRPFLGGGTAPVPDQEELAARLGMPVTTLRTHVHRLRERYRATLRAEVARTVGSQTEVEGELRHLFRVLVGG